MSTAVAEFASDSWQAPREHRQALIDPPLSDWPSLCATNCHDRDGTVELASRRLDALRHEARDHLWSAAAAYSLAYRDVDLPKERPDTLLLSGHQPELFHPGVWFKNFALSHMAHQMMAGPVNLIIDNDIVRSTSVRVPIATTARAGVESIAYDAAGEPLPFEARAVNDQEVFDSFAERVRNVIEPYVSDPFVLPLWQARASTALLPTLGGQLAAARHSLEARCGLQTLEVPLSQVADATPFRWFLAHLIEHAERLVTDYNELLAEYRTTYRLRSRTHPAAKLRRDDDWWELPLWVWTDNDPRRRPLFVRRTPTGRQLGYPPSTSHRWDLDGNASELTSEQLGDLGKDGVRIRPRALITTMYARVVLGDMFLHGIGGAKYDRLTDRLVERFFGIKPPRYATISATLQLPLHLAPHEPDDLRRLDRALRDLHFHPEKHVISNETTQPLMDAKRTWIAALDGTHETADRRHRAIVKLNAQLGEQLATTRDKLQRERNQLQTDLRRHRLLSSREFSFCLFSEQTLAAVLLELLSEAT